MSKNDRHTGSNDDYIPSDSYIELRDQLLQLHLNRDQFGPEKLIAAVVEIGNMNAVVTLAVIADGTTSIYFSSGGGVVGVGKHGDVRAVSRALLDIMSEMCHQLQPAKSFPLPRRGSVRFYTISVDDVQTLEVSEHDLSKGHRLSGAYHVVQALIGVVRSHEKRPS